MRDTHRASDLRPVSAPWGVALVSAALVVVLVLADLVVFPGSGSAAALRITREVHGYYVAMSVESIHDPAESDPMHAQEFDHRVVVKISRSSDRAPVDIESVALDIAVTGYTGSVTLLAPVSGNRASAFEGNVRMARGKMYRILVQFRPAGSSATHEASYEYRHHH